MSYHMAKKMGLRDSERLLEFFESTIFFGRISCFLTKTFSKVAHLMESNHRGYFADRCIWFLQKLGCFGQANLHAQELSDSADEVKATISTGLSVNHLITILIALFDGWIWKTWGIETLFVLSAVLGLCNSAYAASIKIKRE